MKNLFILILLITGTCSCISPYDFTLENNPAFLLVDGQIYDQDSSAIRLYYTNQKFQDPDNILVEDAKVSVIENGNKRINFVFDGLRKKYKPENKTFVGCNNCTYQLNIVLANGKEYISTIDTIKNPDQYEQIYDVYNPTTRKFEVYGNLKTKNGSNLYYQTYFINYKKALICAQYNGCSNYELIPNAYLPCPGFLKSCKGGFPSQFPCEPGITRCWNFKRQRYYSIFGDNILGIGSKRVHKLLEVPMTDYDRYYVEVYQNYITADAYKYMKNLEENGQRSGTLVDPIPPIITGNVFLKGNENQRMLGYFQVSGQQKYGYYVDRTKAPTGVILLPVNVDFIYYDVSLFYFDNAPKLNSCLIPPYAQCNPDSYRTNAKPLNWID
jgi:Domain of unknown function (DUF4249)